MKTALFIFCFAIACNFVHAQDSRSKPTKTHSTLISRDKSLTKTLELKLTSKAGSSNGAGIAWHPVQKKYYVAMAGNADFPLEVFDATGNSLTDSSLSTLCDVRGLWYNTHTKTIQANAYNDFGWVEYMTDEKGLVVYMRKLFSGLRQPDKQSAGAFDEANNSVCFFDNVNLLGIERRSLKNGLLDTSFVLHYEAKTHDEIKLDEEFDLGENYNSTSFAFTGITGSEIALLNTFDLQIEFYNINTGLLVKKVSLPEDAPADFSLNFCYANGMYWLFDKTKRKWIGYK